MPVFCCIAVLFPHVFPMCFLIVFVAAPDVLSFSVCIVSFLMSSLLPSVHTHEAALSVARTQSQRIAGTVIDVINSMSARVSPERITGNGGRERETER